MKIFLPIYCLLLAVATSIAAPEVDRTKAQMVYIDNGQIRLGCDLGVGGAVTYLAKAGGENLINSFDWGRQVQMSFYSGPVPFEPNGKKPMDYWRELGWNPIQAGDSYAHGSKVIEHRIEGNTLYIKCIPMQWPLNNEPGECTFESWFELDGTVAKCRYRLNNHRSDKTQYPARAQELPAVYVNGNLARNFTYTGEKPFANEPMNEIVHIWDGGPTDEPWGKWQSSERWAAMVDEDGEGLGIWSPQTVSFNGGYFGTVVGKGGPTDLETNYTGPVRVEIIDHNIEYEYQCRLIVGNLEEIRKYVYEKTPRILSPNYLFEHSRDGWHYEGAMDSGWPIKGGLDVTLQAPACRLQGPVDFWRAEDAQTIYIKAALKSKTAQVRLLWKTSGDPSFNDAKSKQVEMVGDGKPRVYEVELSDCAAYDGGIAQLAIGIDSATAGDTLKIDSVSCKGETSAIKPFRFVQLCDTQLGFGGYAHDTNMFMQAVRQINEIQPDFVIICGDLVNHVTEQSVADFLEVKSVLEVPCHCVSGNHDVGNEPTKESLETYRRLFGKDYYTFEHKGYRFVVVNTQLWKSPVEGELQKHDRWLEKTLAEAKAGNMPVFIAGHYPLFLADPDEDDGYYNLPKPTRKRLIDLYSQTGVIAVLGGHTHSFIENEYAGIMWVNGETTSKNFDGRDMGFRLWTVDAPDKLSHEFIRIKNQ